MAGVAYASLVSFLSTALSRNLKNVHREMVQNKNMDIRFFVHNWTL